MKRIILILICCITALFACNRKGNDLVLSYFKETSKATNKYSYLWNKDLYAPILFVDTENVLLYANEPDDFGALKKEGEIYVGKLPDDLMVSNTSIEWNGKMWAMMYLPLPQDYYGRINLITHELFHVAQPALGFRGYNSDNIHLDEKDGRIYLRLELEALKKAIWESSESAIKEHLTNAIIFRKYRNTLYEGSKESENQLELSEGLAEYTGMMHAGRNEKEAKKHFEGRIDAFYHYPTFTRSFAYETIPVYGYLLQKKQKEWNKNINNTINLVDFFITAFNIQVPDDLEKAVEKITSMYDGKNIIDEETIREDNIEKIKAAYRDKFVKSPHLDFYFEQMSIGFDPTNIFSLETEGTVYPIIKVIDNWGVLEVEKGALMAPGWNKITVSLPFEIISDSVVGDGWTLKLNDGYKILKDELTGNYSVVKNN